MAEQKNFGLLAVNKLLYDQLERLNNPDITNEELEIEGDRSEAISKVAHQYVESAKLVFQAQKHIDEYGANAAQSLKQITGK